MRFPLTLIAAGAIAAAMAPALLRAQDVDERIAATMDKLEKGQTDEARQDVADLASKYQNHPGILFLEGRVASNAIEAVRLYQSVVDNFPASEWADDALYRIYQYYYSMGLYKTAESKLRQLKKDFPGSPYLTGKPESRLPAKDEEPVRLAEESAPEDSAGSEQQDTAASPSSAPAKVPDSRGAAGGGRYALQVGAFSTSANAGRQKEYLEEKGYTVELANKVRGGRSVYVVLVGSFASAADAQSMRKELKDKYRMDSMVVER